MFFQYPYTDLYSLNLDWLIKSMREVQEKIEQDRGERVLSFNTRTGTVTLLASDVNALGINSVAVVPSISGMSADAISEAYESGVRILLEGSAGSYTKAGFMVAADEGIDICMLSVDMSPIQNQIDAIQDKVNPETAAAGNVFTIDAQGNSAWLPPDATETDALKAKLNKVVPTVGAAHALIPALSYFYYNGELRTANVDIAADAAITDTNSSIVTDAGLTDVLNNAMSAFSQLDEQINPEGGGTPGQFLQVDSNGNTIWGPPATEAAIGAAVTSWLDTNVPTGTTVVVDRSLTVDGAAADAKVTGDELGELKSQLGASTTDMNASFVDGRYTIDSTTNRVIEATGTNKKRAKVSVLPKCAYRITFISYGTSSDVIIFADKFNTVLSSIKGESSRANTIKDVIAPDNAAYLYVTHDTLSSSAVIPSIVQVDNTGYANIKALPSEMLIDYLGAGVHGTTLLAGTEYMGTITNKGNVVASTYSVNKLTSYAVESGKTYRIAGDDVKIYTSTPIVGFGISAFNGTDTVVCTVLIIDNITATVETDYDILFTAPDNGYIFVESYSTYNTLTISNTQYNSTLIDELYNENKDSIANARAIIPESPYNYALNDLFENMESSYIDDFIGRESVIDTDHTYTKYGDDSGVNAPTFAVGSGITRTGASGMGGLFYSRSITTFPHYCLIGRTIGAQMLIKLYKENSSTTENVISISGANGTISYGGQTYGYIHINAAYCLLCIDRYGVTIFDDCGVRVYVPLAYMDGSPKNIAFGFGANIDRLFGYSSFVEFVRNPLSALDFSKCVANNRLATGATNKVTAAIRFTHDVWNNGQSSAVYYVPENNPAMSLDTGLSNNPCIKCITDYESDSGYRTEIGITPIRNLTLHNKLGGLQRFKVSADYFMSSTDNPVGEYFTYIFQFHNAGFTPPQGWPTDPPPLTVRIDPNGHLKAFVTYVANGAVPASDNERTVDEYDLGAFEMDKWMHLDVECRIGWSKALAPKLVICINGQERLNIETPIGFNIVSTGGYVNTHFGLYCPQWHDATFENMHREILVTNIHWEGTQDIV